MRRPAIALALVTFAPFGALAQDAAAPVFEAASVKPNSAGEDSSIDRDGGGLRMINVTLKSCLTFAYGITAPQVLGASWLDSERYDIVAKSLAPATRERVRQMLQALLADRFKLAVHRETRELQVYALVVVKNGTKLTKAEGAPGTGGTETWKGRAVAKATSMAKLADLLAGPRFDLGHPVVDQTGLDGAFDFTLKWTPDNPSAPPPDDPKAPPSIFAALQEQLGLKLEPRKAPVEVLIVDHAEKVPTEN